MEDDTLANAITYILLLRVKSFSKMYVTLCPAKWYHSPPLAHAVLLRITTFSCTKTLMCRFLLNNVSLLWESFTLLNRTGIIEIIEIIESLNEIGL